MASHPRINRATTPPFLLRLFYRADTFPSPSEFSPLERLPPHLQIYTWTDCSLRELTKLIAAGLPSALPDPAIGTRVAFRLVFPDMRSSSMARSDHDGAGRYIAKELGSVVIDVDAHPEEQGDAGANTVNGERATSSQGLGRRSVADDADKTLQDAQFVIGDYVVCAILPPQRSGAIAPPPFTERGIIGGGWSSTGGSGPGPRGAPAGPREVNGYRGNAYGSSGRGSARGGGGPGFGGGRYASTSYRMGTRYTDHVPSDRYDSMPSGEWRRGERLPDEPRYHSYRGRGRGRDAW